MRFSALRRFAPIAVLAAAAVGVPTAATAVPPLPNDPLADFDPFVFDAGVASPDFALSVEGSDAQRKVRTFVDRNGDTVRILTTGRGYNFWFYFGRARCSCQFRLRGGTRSGVNGR